MKTRIIGINKLGINVIQSLPTDILGNLDIYHIQDQKNLSGLIFDENVHNTRKIITSTKDLDQINYIFDSLDLYIVICEVESLYDYEFVTKILNSIKNKSEVILLIKKSNFLTYDLIKRMIVNTTTTMFVNEQSHSSHEFSTIKRSENRSLLIKHTYQRFLPFCAQPSLVYA